MQTHLSLTYEETLSQSVSRQERGETEPGRLAARDVRHRLVDPVERRLAIQDVGALGDDRHADAVLVAACEIESCIGMLACRGRLVPVRGACEVAPAAEAVLAAATDAMHAARIVESCRTQVHARRAREIAGADVTMGGGKPAGR